MTERSTLVLLHGFTQTGRSWDPVVAAMGERYRALAPDLRGHGDNGDARPVSFAAIGDDVLQRAPQRFALAGYSMGGRIALDLALRDPQTQRRITRLTLIGASPGLADPGERAVRRAADEALADEIEQGGVEAFARRWAAQPLFAGQPPHVAQQAHEERLRNGAPGLAASLRGVGTGAMEPLWERLHDLQLPVTLIAGARDAKFRALAQQMAERIPHATIHVVADAGHAVQLEKPAEVAALL
ncbi:2-succinyl-6-hydroxy-2,4-cyclohexadiene-1-carboxylate synthase [Conexibacter sp. JD483]|uniref:2-succinyl-6-hydroxy-2, 4-cyclohexadiene-1-carboxylate synthase n=1 Tax=unclassified Conexibacter TaxID=2627773 RepID=UPI002723E7A7|nr:MULTISPECIES: 2-succinyl-6-hydroxy-2,4-cyclohexadiene-1-carboxylate synthase [unclassified Conexibacter]MDO8185757.1 2-succinyl-6-hydroxy-2,4-cyclohexadiene-1-carboxylate synthase [Conexibacter sp. CPCC 205706]MDO8199134.1 2-succinyl-6-hydroxy-2,4-cyclohexadiene-1-carboxylate synthase [Conexibacter sp. CPCC 205762]MDR9369921.1 2-succinyl-6-hydroxy-2,4-cyclohexadiene-1-carboxylate synthase [Conexibacter sp. JD483]